MQKAAEIHKKADSYFIHLPLEIISLLPLWDVFPIETDCHGDALHSDGPNWPNGMSVKAAFAGICCVL